MDATTIGHSNQQNSRGWSYNLWRNFPFVEARNNPNKALLYDAADLIRNQPLFAGTTAQMGCKPYLDTNATLQGSASDPLGLLEFVTPATQDKEVQLQWNTGVGGMVLISQTSGSIYKYLFEAVVKVSSIGNTLSWCVGCAKPAATGDSTLADDGTGLGDFDFIGFQVLEADGDGPTAFHKETSGATTVINAAAAVGTLAASTFYRLGFEYDPNLGKIFYWFNGTKLATASDVTASTFPLDVLLSPFVGIKTHDGNAKTLGLAGLRVGVLLN